MKYALALAIAIAIAVAGCASAGDAHLAQADCKVAPVTPASVASAPAKRVDSLAQRQAEADLRSTQYGRRQMANNPFGTTAEALRDCNRR